MKKIWIGTAALVLAALPLMAHEEGGMVSADVVPVLSVQGSGQTRVEPDEAVVRLGVTAQAPTARAAQDQVNKTAAAILAAVRALGVAAEQVQTSELSLGPVYSSGGPQERNEPRITGYQANNVVSVTLAELNRVGPVIDAGLGAGANRLEGVMFGLRNDAPARAAALANAVTEARGKAEALARAAGVRLVEIVEIVEGGVSVFTPTMARGGRVAMEAMDMAMATPVSSGQVSVDASVTLRYRIAPQAGAGAPR
ncbi:MAG TPA: SIMPL domain-containing protein [Thermoanaerobaculia bacterium]|nr:SIMPL domain-containing protein [Thermoanaerobaculia bacterium]